MPASTRLGIVAGGGDVPGRLMAECRATGREVYVLALTGHADAARFPATPDAWIRIGQAGRGIRLLRAAGVRDLVVVGGVRRPTLLELRPDLRTALFMARIGRRYFADGALLSAVTAELEKEGFRIVAPEELLDDMLVRERLYGSAAPDAAGHADIALGIAAARDIGRRDIGQAAVVQRGRVLGVEDSEGTDALIRRCAAASRAGPGGILVKVSKPGQERRIDLPTIGVATVETAAESGLRGIAVEAGGALIVDAEAVARAADQFGIFVIGVAVPGDGGGDDDDGGRAAE
jgi:UDP-2,3-diacylglucosamine hydrolase